MEGKMFCSACENYMLIVKVCSSVESLLLVDVLWQ